MKKYNLYLSDRQRAKLDEESERLGISVAELMRRIVDRYFEE